MMNLLLQITIVIPAPPPCAIMFRSCARLFLESRGQAENAAILIANVSSYHHSIEGFKRGLCASISQGL
ncbi:hypothetical protein C1J02_03795 [Sulfitobacter sp. SK011]|nr:hypothetical protein C1J02_03795 [Sulfitobacter sp. SK011]